MCESNGGVPAGRNDAIHAGGERALVLFPGGLGDFLCFLPTLLGLLARHRGPATLVARPSYFELLRLPGCRFLSMDDRVVADLFAATTRLTERTHELLGGHTHVYAWTGFGDENFFARLARASGGSVRVYRFRDMGDAEHACDYFARCAGIVPLPPPPDVFAVDDPWCEAFRRAHSLAAERWLTIHPGSGSPRKNWAGFAALAAEWRRRRAQPVVVLCGPTEEETAAGAAIGAAAVRVGGVGLARVAALLRHGALYAGNDSGVSHLAGVLGLRGVALFADTAPEHWSPRGGGIAVLRAASACSACGAGVFCEHRLPVARVLDALEEIAANGA